MVKISMHFIIAATTLIAAPALAAPTWRPQNPPDLTARGLTSTQPKVPQPAPSPQSEASEASASSSASMTHLRTQQIGTIGLSLSRDIHVPSSPLAVTPNQAPSGTQNSEYTPKMPINRLPIWKERYKAPAAPTEDFEDRGPTLNHPEIERVWLTDPQRLPSRSGTGGVLDGGSLHSSISSSGKRKRNSVDIPGPYRKGGGSSSSSLAPGARP